MKKEINIVLGERIKKARWENSLTREKLAEKIDVSPRFLADVESGKIGVSIQTLKSLSIALNKSCDYLLGLPDSAETELTPFYLLLKSLDKKYHSIILSILQQLHDLE